MDSQFSIRKLKISLSPVKAHFVLFFSLVLDRLIIPYAVQTDLFSEPQKEELEALEEQSFFDGLERVSQRISHG